MNKVNKLNLEAKTIDRLQNNEAYVTIKDHKKNSKPIQLFD